MTRGQKTRIPDCHHIKKQLGELTEEQKRRIYERWDLEGVRMYTFREEFGLTEFSIYTLIRTVKFKDGVPYWEKDKVKAWVAHPTYRAAQERRAKRSEGAEEAQEGV